MARQGVLLTVRIRGVRQTLDALRDLPKEASTALRTESRALAGTLATSARRAAVAQARQPALVARTIRARTDRVPVVTAGGVTRVGRHRVPVYKVLFGAEFGATYLRQFRPHLGRQGYFFFPTVEREAARISRAWNRAADRVIRQFGRGA